MDEVKNIVNKSNRVLYVEPNDIYGSVDGVPLTPDYSDYCISVNLIAEVVSRQKQSGSDATKKYLITWTTRPELNEDGTPKDANKWVSFLTGKDASIYGGDENETFLTTYYTDINYEDVAKENIVEGLGIESVQVSFESYYTPTVIIKFVDVRGSSLFGREEHVHDADMDLTSSSVFGAFFTIPYPRFRLQIKGFYGHGVTYQLTCSNFTGSFNAKTGNYEAVATFIGYSYSLLTDIPFRYLVAAPLCDYVGRDYWEEKLHTPAWALSNGRSPVKLFNLMEQIKGLTFAKNVQNKLMTDEDSKLKENVMNERRMLSDLSMCLIEFVNAMKVLGSSTANNEENVAVKVVKGNNVNGVINGEDGNEQLILFSRVSEIQAGDRLALASTNLVNAFNNYNQSFLGKEFKQGLLPNGRKPTYGASSKITFAEFADVKRKSGSGVIESLTLNTTQQSVETLKELDLGGRKLSKTSAEFIWSRMHEEQIPDFFENYILIVDLNGFNKKINERIRELTAQSNEIDKKISTKLQTVAANELGFTPYIGDIFKIVMCHLETFIHILWTCFDNIQGADRSPGHLNVDLSSTDVVGVDKNKECYIYPWPGVFSNGSQTQQGGQIDKSVESWAWIGDFSHNFEEERVVIELYKAIQRNKDKSSDEGSPLALVAGLPIMPSDLNDMASIFRSDITTGIGSLAGYLGLRAAKIFGILIDGNMPIEVATALGKMEAYNYFSYNGSRSDIKTNLLSMANNKPLSQILHEISFCTNDEYATHYEKTDKDAYEFETVGRIATEYNRNGRHPIFKSGGNRATYVHYYTEGVKNNKVSLVPDRILPYSAYKDVFVYRGDEKNSYFIPKRRYDANSVSEANGYLYKSGTRVFLDSVSDTDKAAWGNDIDKYTNVDMFDVIYDEEYADAVVRKYEEIKSGTFKVYEETFTDDFGQVLDKLWHVRGADFAKFVGSGMQFALDKNDIKSYQEGGIKGRLYPRTVEEARKHIEDGDIAESKEETHYVYDKFDDTLFENVNMLGYNADDSEWQTTGNTKVPLSECYIPEVACYRKNGDKYVRESLFSEVFYYTQNNNFDKIGDKMDRVKAKAYLFLQSIPYDYSNVGVAGFLDWSKKSGGIYMTPFGYLLFLGSLLWRIRYSEKNGKDPIVCPKGYVCPDVNHTFLMDVSDSNTDRQDRLSFIRGTYEKNPYTVPVSRFFGVKDDKFIPDAYVTNKLISLFEDFAGREWRVIMDSLELRKMDGGVSGMFDEKSFSDRFTALLNVAKQADNTGDDILALLCPSDEEDSPIFGNFFGNYRYIHYDGSKGDVVRLQVDVDNANTQEMLRGVMMSRSIVLDSSGIRYSYDNQTANGVVTVRDDYYKAYLSGFCDKITQIAQSERNVVTSYSDDTNISRDFLLPIYMTIKMLWDKWLVSIPNKKVGDRTVDFRDYFNVENFFSNFTFIDAFYRNIYDKFIINLDTLRKSYDGRDADGTMFQFLGDIADDHRCMFFALPDFLDLGSPTADKAVSVLQDAFRPIPFSRLNPMNDENRFVILYTPKMSDVPNGMNGFKSDYFRIWNPATGKWDDNMPETFKVAPYTEDSSSVTRYGYYVPSFGVAFARQNNHLFKDLKMNMSTPLATSASISATAQIAEKGAGGLHKVALFGQDLYPVYSNYSYIVEVEMMGDAQIQPLMYFQLMNIPLWSGVYMIFNVTHDITPGNMTTRFKGMKLSRNPLPYNSSWYTFLPDLGEGTEGYGSDGGVTDTDYRGPAKNYPRPAYQEATGDVEDYYSQARNRENGVEDEIDNVEVDDSIRSLYNRLYQEIKDLPENKPVMKWNVCLSSVVRKDNTESDHNIGHAMDLKVQRFNEKGEGTVVKAGEYQRELYTAFDILYTLHRNEVRQVLIEYKDMNKFVQYGTRYNVHVLHVATKHNANDDKCEFKIMRNANGEYTAITNGQKDVVPWFTEHAPIEFKRTAYRHYMAESKTIRKIFPNLGDFNDDDLVTFFDSSDDYANYTAPDLDVALLGRLKTARGYLKNALEKKKLTLNDVQFCAIAGNFVQESGFSHTAKSKDGGAEGIAQWRGSRREEFKNTFKKGILEASFEEQLDFVVRELTGETKYKEYKDTLKGMTDKMTIAEATLYFHDHYEKSGDPEALKKKRVGYANRVMEYIKAGKV